MSDSQPPPQAQQPQQPQQPQLMRPDDILRLQSLNDDERQKYRQAMVNFWSMTQQHAAGTPEHSTARQKIFEYSQKFIARERAFRRTKQQQQQQQQQGNQGQSSQGNQGAQQNQGQVKQEQPQAPQKTEGGGAPQEALAQLQAQQQAQQQQVPAQARTGAPTPSETTQNIQKHVAQFPIPWNTRI
jgi:hypothetical protein